MLKKANGVTDHTMHTGLVLYKRLEFYFFKCILCLCSKMMGSTGWMETMLGWTSTLKGIIWAIFWSDWLKFIFDFLEAAIEARGQKWTKTSVGEKNTVYIFLQTEFQKHLTKEVEMTGIFHFSLKSTRPDHCVLSSSPLSHVVTFWLISPSPLQIDQ